MLRPGDAVVTDGTVSLLKRLLPMLRAAFPQTPVLVRLDGGFTTPEVFDFLEAEPGLDYTVAMGKNAMLLHSGIIHGAGVGPGIGPAGRLTWPTRRRGAGQVVLATAPCFDDRFEAVGLIHRINEGPASRSTGSASRSESAARR